MNLDLISIPFPKDHATSILNLLLSRDHMKRNFPLDRVYVVATVISVGGYCHFPFCENLQARVDITETGSQTCLRMWAWESKSSFETLSCHAVPKIFMCFLILHHICSFNAYSCSLERSFLQLLTIPVLFSISWTIYYTHQT